MDFHLRDGEIAIYDPVAGEWIQTRAERTETAEARAETAEAEAAQLREELARLKARR